MNQDYQDELNLKIKAGTPLIQITSYEWRRIHGCVLKASLQTNKEFFLWNNSEGIKKWDKTDKEFKQEADIREPAEALTWFRTQAPPLTILLMEDLHVYFDSMQWREILGALRAVSRNTESKILILSQPIRRLLPELEKDVYILDIPLPHVGILKTVIKSAISTIEKETQINLKDHQVPESDRDSIAEAALGLTDMEATYTIKEIIHSQERLTEEEIPLIVERKEQIIKKSGILEYFHPQEAFGDVGGLDNLKSWLQNRKAGFRPEAKDFGMTPPKGVLLLGVQGCGKSLLAKAIASEWKLPLLKFDLGKVFGGVVGESEGNIRRALGIAEAVSPSILWIDEIEKGLSGVGSSNRTDSGTTARVFGTMLTWMQDKEKPVFVIATANNIEQLPPELLRKGRFDEIFFVDLPGSKSREEIWKIHLEKRLTSGRFKDCGFDLSKLAEVSKWYSGAEIEEAINEALYIAYNAEREVSIEDLSQTIQATYPLSKVMAEKITKLREWAEVRARSASQENIESLELKEGEKIPKLKQEIDNPFME